MDVNFKNSKKLTIIPKSTLNKKVRKKEEIFIK